MVILVDLPTVLPKKVKRIQPPLWAAYLAAYLEDEVLYLDGRLESPQWMPGLDNQWWVYGCPTEILAEKIIRLAASKKDSIGIHVGVSTEMGIAHNLVGILGKNCGNRIVLGGPGVSLIPQKYLPDEVEALEVCPVQGISKDLSISLPSRTDLNLMPRREVWEKYGNAYRVIGNFHSGPPLEEPAVQMITSDGCGGKCKFCPTQNQQLVRRSLLSIEKEIEGLHSAGYKCLQIEDDNFLGWSPGQILFSISILEKAVEKGFRAIEFPNGLLIKSLLSKHFADWLNAALKRGVKVKLSLPFESGSDEILKIIKKPHSFHDCEKLLAILLPLMERGLRLESFLQIGFMIQSGNRITMEGNETINQTLKFAKRLTASGVEANVFFNSPLPGTKFFEIWRDKFPEAPWESLLFTQPSLFYPQQKRLDLIQKAKIFNSSARIQY